MLRRMAGTLVLLLLACDDSDGAGTPNRDGGSEAGSNNGKDASGSGATDANGGQSNTGADAASGDAGGLVSCDFRKLLCKRVEPMCPEGQVPEVIKNCYGDCVPIERCACEVAEECPHSESYTCLKSAGHCGPYVR